MTKVPLGYECDGCQCISAKLHPGWEERREPTPDAPGFDSAEVHCCPDCSDKDIAEYIEYISQLGVMDREV